MGRWRVVERVTGSWREAAGEFGSQRGCRRGGRRGAGNAIDVGQRGEGGKLDLRSGLELGATSGNKRRVADDGACGSRSREEWRLRNAARRELARLTHEFWALRRRRRLGDDGVGILKRQPNYPGACVSYPPAPARTASGILQSVNEPPS